MTKEENIKFREDIIKKRFFNNLGYELNLDDPRTFNEKIQWLKLYNHDPLITKCADKYLAREYIKEKVGEEYLIPLLGVWDNPDDIDFDSLPNQFVLKVNWGTAQNIIVKDKSKLDIEKTKEQLKNWLDPFENLYYKTFEWQYKNIPPKIICEKYIKNNTTENLIVYGVYCFNKKPYFIHTITDAHTNMDKCNIYDINWNKIDLVYIFDNTDYEISKPKNLDIILSLSKILSEDFNHVRVDFFCANDLIYVGELTFTTSNGFSKFNPIEWDYKFGELFDLPKEKKIEYDTLDRDTLIKQATLLEPLIIRYRELENKIKSKDNVIKSKENIIKSKNEEIQNLKKNINAMSLNINWFNCLTLFSISNNKEYIRIIIFGLKFTFRVNEKGVNKIAWWIPVKKWRNNFRDKFKI
ncbi:ATP-grasp fold amidoligase family protein [Brachyspira pilosicoli]|uniref:ATP-grasp fold amidoligase family protein n=1 Tax=Brachyspira pilosicoli TaxID=52584 RepID=UPI00300712E2